MRFDFKSLLSGVVNTDYFAIAVETVMDLLGVSEVGFEEVGNFSDVGGLEFFTIEVWVDLEIEVEEVLGTVVLVHADVPELEVDFNVVVGEEGGKFDKLVPEVFNKLIVYVADPGFQLYGDVLKHEVHTLLLL